MTQGNNSQLDSPMAHGMESMNMLSPLLWESPRALVIIASLFFSFKKATQNLRDWEWPHILLVYLPAHSVSFGRPFLHNLTWKWWSTLGFSHGGISSHSLLFCFFRGFPWKVSEDPFRIYMLMTPKIYTSKANLSSDPQKHISAFVYWYSIFSKAF